MSSIEMRKALKSIETDIVTSLAHQPMDDEQCNQFLYDALVRVFNAADSACTKIRGDRNLAASPKPVSAPSGVSKRVVERCGTSLGVATCLATYQRWRKGEGEYAFNDDPTKCADAPFTPKELSFIEDAAIARLRA